jgi:hypothetical protein
MPVVAGFGGARLEIPVYVSFLLGVLGVLCVKNRHSVSADEARILDPGAAFKYNGEDAEDAEKEEETRISTDR